MVGVGPPTVARRVVAPRGNRQPAARFGLFKTSVLIVGCLSVRCINSATRVISYLPTRPVTPFITGRRDISSAVAYAASPDRSTGRHPREQPSDRSAPTPCHTAQSRAGDKRDERVAFGPRGSEKDCPSHRSRVFLPQACTLSRAHACAGLAATIAGEGGRRGDCLRRGRGRAQSAEKHGPRSSWCDDSRPGLGLRAEATWVRWANRAHSGSRAGGLRQDGPPTSPRGHGHVDPWQFECLSYA